MQKVGFFKSIQFKFVLINTLLILLAIQLMGVYFSDRLEKQYTESFISGLKSQAKNLVYSVGETIRESEQSNTPSSQSLTNKINNQLTMLGSGLKQIQVIDQTGKILATTDQRHTDFVGKRTTNPLIMRDVLTLTTMHTRTMQDPSTGERIEVLTDPIYVNGQNVGIIYIEKSLEAMYSSLRNINSILTTGTLFSLIITALLGIFLARTITKPLANMREQALAVSQGDFSRKVKFYDTDEIGQLAMAFNSMTNKLQDANATTESERRKLRSVLAYMTDGVLATDREGNVILMNNRAEEMLGVYRQDIFGMSIVQLLKIEDQYTIDDLYNLKDSFLLDLSPEESKYILRVKFSVFKKENGMINGLIAVLHDVTEQEQIESERREFVANVSHELRTPLTTMKSYLEALQDGAIKDENLAPRFLEVTQTETERMIRLVNDLLQLSKLDTKDYELEFEKTDFVEFFHKTIDRFELSKKQNIKFLRKLPKNPLYVIMDRDKLTQVIDNIISNATKYSPDGGTITFQILKQGKSIRVSISDQGVGIPKENLSKVFNRFYRVDRARSRKLGGTGLGLAIAKEMIHAHGGEIWAESEWNKGTTIFFTLPWNSEGDSK